MTAPYSKGEMIALAILCFVIPIIFAALRVWAKRLGTKKLGMDDYLLFVGLVCQNDLLLWFLGHFP